MKETSLQELIELLIQISGKRPEVIHDAARNNDIRQSVLDNQAAVNELQWQPAYTLKEGLCSMLRV
jgi:UDP-glucose 4-epimerase